MSLYVLSDLHVRGADDPVYRSLLAVIRGHARAGDTLVLAGDIFDLFVGGKEVFRVRYAEFFREAASALERGVVIHYIEGNHDFLMKQAFSGVPRLSLHPHEVSVEIAGKRFFFVHGDTVNKRDYRYRALRGFFRSPPIRALVWALPGEWVDWIGNTSSRVSRDAKPETPGAGIPGFEQLRVTYRSYAAEQLSRGYDFVVMGHCHDLDEMSFKIGDRVGQYINVGYPRAHGSFLSWSPGDEKIQRERLPE